MPNGLVRTKSGGLQTIKNGKVILYQPPITNDPWRPANANINANGKVGYKKVSNTSKYYWKVVRNSVNGKWRISENHKRNYFIKKAPKVFVIPPFINF